VNQVAIKLAVADIPPVLQGALRSAGAGILVLISCRLGGRNLFERDGSLLHGLAAGALFGTEFAVLFHALQLASASHTVLFLYSAPIFVAIGTHLLVPGERLHAGQIAGFAAALAGVAVAFADALGASGPRELEGDALALVAALVWAATTVLIKAGRLAHVDPAKTLLYQLGVSAVFMPGLSLALGESWAIRPGRMALGAMGFQIVIVAWLSYLGWFWLIRHYPAGRLSSFTFLTPLFGMLAGGLILHERLSAWLGIAILLVSIGIYLVNRQPPVHPELEEETLPGP
jgi:drug/metabolite transporter (DMT)-like permease